MNAYTTINNHCRICGAQTKPLFVVQKWPLNECKQCHFKQVEKQPSKDDLTKIYSNKYFVSSKYSENNFSQQKELERRLKLLNRYVPEGSTVIDIGCGIGDFLSYAQSKYNLWGHDISEDAISEAKKTLPELSEKLRSGMIENTKYAENYYDAVVLWDVIEHIWDPKSVVEQVLSYVKPSGYLIFSTPYADALTAKLMGKKWAFMTPPEHLGFFGKNSIEQLFARELKHKVKFISAKGKWVNLGFLMYKLDKVFKNPITNFLKKFFSGVLSGIPLYVPTNDIVYVVIQKGKH
jgi:2-polyprenyl-3-methyl-5-hydroxy-6-metoxy-1,4-benzoquinol methylase